MKKYVPAALAMSIMLLPSSAFASIPQYCTYTREEPIAVIVTGEDDPNIPNCVMYPTEPYPDGICERVHVRYDPAGSTYMAPCNQA